ncbi:MAG: PEGA domain-containing protein [Candidatus Buchananbacteria bacterium]|nr:PEGA domain-containing protein [Candidatus Buchananbacteria bacterium]
MNPRLRFVVFVIFFALFLITAPLVVLYTQGYRYNFNNNRVQRTGILIVSSVPRRADIYLNNEKYAASQTPTKVEQLLAGDYEIRLEKEGYHSWRKRLPIFQNGSTFAEKVYLWKVASPELVSTSTATWNTPVRGAYAIFNTPTSTLLDADRDRVTPLGTTTKWTVSDWSPNNRLALLTTTTAAKQHHYALVNLDRGTIESQPWKYERVRWNTNSDSRLVGKLNRTITQIDIATNQTATVATTTPTNTDFLLVDNTTYTRDARNLYRHRNMQIETVGALECATCAFVDSRGPRLFMLDSERQQLEIVNLDDRRQSRVVTARGVDWLSNDVLLYYNDWELWIYDLNKKEPELITRLSQPITAARWHSAGRHIIFASGGVIKVIELDNREFRNITDLAQFTTVSGLIVNSDGTALYANAASSTSWGVYKLELQ